MHYTIVIILFSTLLLSFAKDKGFANPDKEKALAFEAEVKSIERQEALITREQIIEKYSLGAVVLPPTHKPETVKEMINEEARQVVNKVIPLHLFDKIQAAALKKYRLYNYRDIITLTFRKPATNKWSHEQNRLGAVTNKFVRFGDLNVAVKDIHPSELAHLFVANNRTAIANYITAQKFLLNQRRDAKKAKVLLEITKRLWDKTGYIYNVRKKTFMSKELFIELKLKENRDAIYNETNLESKKMVMRKHGFKQGDDGKWIDTKAKD